MTTLYKSTTAFALSIYSTITTKNEHKANVQCRWDNTSRDKMRRAFQNWRKRVGYEDDEQTRGEEDERGRERERTYGIKNWG
eukprot:5724359-Pleurochrysis_carterae.AAC.4